MPRKPSWRREQAVIDRWIAAREAELIGLRRHLHAHPELSGEEFATAALIEQKLIQAGLAPQLLAGRNGVLCDIGQGERVVALRADLDALPLTDSKDTPYRSTVPGACHACGHDVHAVALLGAGLALARLADRGGLPGRVRLIFQPSEEKPPFGANDVIDQGGLKDVAAIFSVHCFPYLPAGHVGIRTGALTAATDLVEVRLTGRGGHTARPHLTADLVHALSRVVIDTPTLLSRRMDPRDAVTMVFGAIHAGQAANTIPSEGFLRATVRVLGRRAWSVLPDLVPRLIQDTVVSTGAQAEVDYVRGVPPVVNDRATTAIMAEAAARVLGPEQVHEAEVSMGGEDFAFYLDQVPGTMLRLGVGRPGAEPVDLHHADFDVDERAIACAARILARTAIDALVARD